MFYRDGILLKSDVLNLPRIRHGFSGKEGGFSAHPYTATLNLAMGREDSDETVRRNIDVFAKAATNGVCGMENAVCAPQIHSAVVRRVGVSNGGEGVLRPAPAEGDGFVTDEPDVFLFVRVADCAPVLLAGEKADGSPVVSAVHAGWRGTVKGIVLEALAAMRELGCEIESVRAAIGPRIGRCCYEVGGDLWEETAARRGADFARRHVTPSPTTPGKFFCDLGGMNRELLLSAGVREDGVDISPDCTFCMSDVYYSHRKTAGKRGAMGAGVGIARGAKRA